MRSARDTRLMHCSISMLFGDGICKRSVVSFSPCKGTGHNYNVQNNHFKNTTVREIVPVNWPYRHSMADDRYKQIGKDRKWNKILGTLCKHQQKNKYRLESRNSFLNVTTKYKKKTSNEYLDSKIENRPRNPMTQTK